MKAMFQVGIASVVGLMASGVEARLVEWTGGAGPDASGVYEWSDGGNWSGGDTPGAGDIPVFGVEGRIIISTLTPGGVYHRFSGMRFERGSVIFTADRYFYFESPTNEIFVAYGSSACISNVVEGWGGGIKTILKVGKGSLEMRKIGESTSLSAVVAEGELASLSASELSVRGAVEGVGGNIRLSSSGLRIASGGNSMSVSGGTVGGEWSHPAGRTGAAMIPADVPVFGDASSSLMLSGGDMHLYSASGVGCGFIGLAGGRLHTHSTISPVSGATTESPSVLRMDGGELVVKLDVVSSPPRYSYEPISSSSAMRVEVGPLGAVLSQEAAYGFFSGVSITIGQSFASAAGEADDGGVRQYGYVPWVFKKPLSISGPYMAEGGESVIHASADLSSTPRFFGSGAMTLVNQRLTVASRDAATTLSLPGVGKTLTVSGGSALALRTDSSKAAVCAQIERLSFSDGGVLYLRDGAGGIGEDNMCRVTVAGGIPTKAANGRVLLPVVGTTDGAQDTYFLTYGGDGFKKIDLAPVSSLTSSSSDNLVAVSSSWTSVPANARRAVDALKLVKGTTLDFSAGAELTIGDGTNPAMLLLCGAYLTGTDTSALRFGESRGVICVQGCLYNSPSETTANRLTIPIASANGVDYVSYPHNEGTARHWHFVQVSGDNTYSGETHVGAVAVLARSTQCFSSGRVCVTGGEAHGGQVRFDVADGTWQNDFRVSGWGVRNTEYHGSQYNGALSFSKNAALTGTVELERLARLCAQAGATGVVSGVVSGDRLQIYDSPGVVRLTGANTYSGGTEIVDGTLEVASADALGTGSVLLDGGTLRFVNRTPVVFANAIEPRSVGRVEICGAGVEFTHDSWTRILPCKSLARGARFSYPSLSDARWVPYRKGTMMLVW